MKCPECGTEFEKHRWNQKYCHPSCTYRNKCRRSSRRRRTTPEKREKYYADYRRRYNKRKNLGLCPRCGDERDDKEFTFCMECRELLMHYNRRNRCC